MLWMINAKEAGFLLRFVDQATLQLGRMWCSGHPCPSSHRLPLALSSGETTSTQQAACDLFHPRLPSLQRPSLISDSLIPIFRTYQLSFTFPQHRNDGSHQGGKFIPPQNPAIISKQAGRSFLNPLSPPWHIIIFPYTELTFR
jgi:hypothetical protein